MKDFIILIAWHIELDPQKHSVFMENKRTFELWNPNAEIITIINPFEDNNIAWLSTDLSIFMWFKENGTQYEAKRYIIIEWDCWCDCRIEEYFDRVWDCDLVVPTIKYPERDEWNWFNTAHLLPERARPHATGISPFCAILISYQAMVAIGDEILMNDYKGLNSELRFGTIATMLNFDPVVNPVYSRSLGWRTPIFFDTKYRGLHHPRKAL